MPPRVLAPGPKPCGAKIHLEPALSMFLKEINLIIARSYDLHFWRATEDQGLTFYYLVHSQSVPGSSLQELVCCACSAGDGILSQVSPVHSHIRKSGEV